MLIITDFVSDQAVFARIPAVSYCERLYKLSNRKLTFQEL